MVIADSDFARRGNNKESMRNRRTKQSWLKRFAMGLGLLVVSCGSDSSQGDMDAPVQCTENPVTHLQIINSCTSTVAIDKPARLAKFRPGAPLQPLPN